MNVDALINAESEHNQVLNVAELSLSHKDSPENYPKYMAALTNAMEELVPEFDKKNYGDLFRAAAEDAHWFATSLITNSEREGDGATRLWSMAACSPNDDEKQLIKRHAVDESNHSVAYLRMLDYTFPGAVEQDFREELERNLSPRFTMKQEPEAGVNTDYARPPSVDDYIQMNIAEIRTAIHHMLQRKALEHFCPDENKTPMFSISRALLRDELLHVGYTAKLIEQRADEVEDLNALFLERLVDFNEITKQELKQKVFD